MRFLMAHNTTLGEMRRFMAIRAEVRDEVLYRQVVFFYLKYMGVVARAASLFFNGAVREKERAFFIRVAFYAGRDFLFF